MTPSQSKPDFNVGDVVRLKSGSPNMVVTATTAVAADLTVARCESILQNQRHEGDFRADMLVRANTD